MKIAHIIPASISYPLTMHNGRYDWVHELATRQAKQGHAVTVYGNADSTIEDVATVGLATLSDDKLSNNEAIFRLAFSHDHDVYHSHFDNLHYKLARETERPIVFTQHWWPTDETIAAAKAYDGVNVWAVPPTQYMLEQDKAHGIQSHGHIYHGIDLGVFKPSDAQPSNRLLFVGRISPEKNLDIAIAAAKEANVGLDIIGKIAPKNQEYWRSLEPLVDGDLIRYLGPKNHSELIDYYTAALGVLFPSNTNEAFGLVAIEAQACGSPLVMQRGGSRGELVDENVTGFLCENSTDYVSAITRLTALKSDDCVAFAHRFDVQTMVNNYDKLYEQLTAS